MATKTKNGITYKKTTGKWFKAGAAPAAPAASPLATRVKTDPALLERALRDPGLRSKLPDNLLPADALKTRQQNQYLGDLGDIASPLAGRSLVNTARQAVDSEFAPLLADVGRREQIVDRSAGIQGDWAKRYYGDLNSLLGGIRGAQETANTGAIQGATDRGVATQGAITAADGAAQQRLGQDAEVRGAGLQGSAPADLAARTAQQSQQATAESGRAVQSADDFGGAQAAFLKGLQGAAAQQGGEYQRSISDARGAALGELAQSRTDLGTKKAGVFTDTLLKLRQGEQQNAVTAAALNVKQDSAAASADANAGAEGRKYGYTPSEWLGLPAATRTGLVAAAHKKTKSDQGYGPGKVGMNKYGYTYAEWTKLPAKDQADARKGKGGGKGSGGKDTSATNVQVTAAQGGVTAAQDAAKAAGIPLDNAHRTQIHHLLTGGRKVKTISVTSKTADGGSVTREVQVGPDGQPRVKNVRGKDGKVTQVPLPALPDIEKQDAVLASIALDVLIDGHVSRHNARRLHSRGLTVEDLGLPSYTAWKKAQQPTRPAQNSPSERAPGGT